MMAEAEPHKPPFLPDYAKALLDQLAGEYRIIQDKIDKIASFRFTIRGWSVTLVVAFAFGANTMKLPPYWILSAFLPLLAFLFMERSQQRNHDALCMRAVRVEKRIWRTLRRCAPSDAEIMIGGMVPRLAHELVEEHQSSRPIVRWFRSKGYVLFYGAQMLLVLAAAMWVGYFQHETPGISQQPGQIRKMGLRAKEASAMEGSRNGEAPIGRRKP